MPTLILNLPNELFIVKSYDDDSILDIFITDNAFKCKEIFADLDSRYCGNDSDDDLHPLNSGIFEETCKKQGVNVERANSFCSYGF